MHTPSLSTQTHCLRLLLLLLLVNFTLITITSASAGSRRYHPASKEKITTPSSTKTINIYSYRQSFLILPLLERFTRHTGIQTRVLYADKGLIERVKAEGKNSPADILFTSDIGLLVQAGKEIAQPVDSSLLKRYIPAIARANDNSWFGLTWRARVLFVSRERVADTQITYEDLATPKWRGRICFRDAQHPYNIALFASLLVHHGEATTRRWMEGLKRNLERRPAGNDRTQLRKIYAGACDIAIGNTYYIGIMQTNIDSPEQQNWARAVRIVFPHTTGRGTHANISGMAMMKHAPHPDETRKLMHFLVSREAQEIYAQTNFEYPIRADAKPAKLVQDWGVFIPDTLSLEAIAAARRSASRLVDKTRLNF